MSRRSLVLTALTALALACAAPVARADDPGPLPWTVPHLIPVTGHDGVGHPDPAGEVTIVIRDLANNPVPGAQVVLDFSGCNELRLCADAHEAGVTVNCAAKTVSAFTNANGLVRLHVIGTSVAAPGGPGAGMSCARIYANGILGSLATVAIYDLSGGNGLTPADLSAWMDDFFSGSYVGRADYDDSGIVGPGDLSKWLEVFFAANSVLNCSPEGVCS